jgi:hypothetical protein
LGLLEPEALLLAAEPLPEVPLEDDDGGVLELPDWSLLLDEDDDGELELGEELGVLELELLPLSLFIARLPVDEPEEPDEPDCERRESLPRSQAESPKAAASAAASAVRNSFFCSMSTIS